MTERFPEYINLSEMQRSSHDINSGNKIGTRFSAALPTNELWYTERTETLVPSHNENGKIIYNQNPGRKSHLLGKCKMVFSLPELNPPADKALRFRWKYKVGTLIMKKAIFTDLKNTNVVFEIDRRTVDNYYDFLCDDRIETIKENLGICPELTDWTERKNSYDSLVIDQPWPFSYSTDYNYPLIYCGNNESSLFSISCEFENKLENLLEVQEYEDDEWNDVNPGLYFDKLFIESPKLIVSYSLLGPEGKKFFENCIIPKNIYLPVMKNNPVKVINSKHDLEISNFENCGCMALFFRIRKAKSEETEFRNLDDEHNILVDNVSLKYSDSYYRFEKIPECLLWKSNIGSKTPNKPLEKGKYCYMLDELCKKYSCDPPIAVNMTTTKASLIFELKEECKKSDYIIECEQLVCKVLKIEKNDNIENSTKKFVMKLENY